MKHDLSKWIARAAELSEQHPREQGLKHEVIPPRLEVLGLSEQHPREQGLKQPVGGRLRFADLAFRATSKRTRIETGDRGALRSAQTELSEQHPREQGLKLGMVDGADLVVDLSEQHPREQGLKPPGPRPVFVDLPALRARFKRTMFEAPYR